MAYGVYGDVIALVPELASVTYPSTSTLTTWLTRISNIIDSYLAVQSYAVPITDATDVAMLTHYTTIKVAAMAINAMSLGDAYREKAENWEEEFDTFLADLKKRLIKLQSQVPTKSNSGVLYMRKEQRYPTRAAWEDEV